MDGHPPAILPPRSPMTPRNPTSSLRSLALLLVTLACLGSRALGASASAPTASKPAAPAAPTMNPQPRLEDFIAAPGSSQKFQPFMLHADYWVGLDQRVKLDSIVFVLD